MTFFGLVKSAIALYLGYVIGVILCAVGVLVFMIICFSIIEYNQKRKREAKNAYIRK